MVDCITCKMSDAGTVSLPGLLEMLQFEVIPKSALEIVFLIELPEAGGLATKPEFSCHPFRKDRFRASLCPMKGRVRLPLRTP